MGFGPDADGSERLIVERTVFIALPRDLAKQLFECFRLFAASSFVVELIPRVTRACKFLVVPSELLDSGCVHSGTMASSRLDIRSGQWLPTSGSVYITWSCADKVLLVLRGERRSCLREISGSAAPSADRMGIILSPGSGRRFRECHVACGCIRCARVTEGQIADTPRIETRAPEPFPSTVDWWRIPNCPYDARTQGAKRAPAVLSAKMTLSPKSGHCEDALPRFRATMAFTPSMTLQDPPHDRHNVRRAP